MSDTNPHQGLRDVSIWQQNFFIGDDMNSAIGFNLSNGSNYRGNMKNFAADGFGTLCSANHFTFSGDFEGGRIHGTGRMIMDGHILEGLFENGMLLDGSHQLPNGIIFIGKPGPDCSWTGPCVIIRYGDGREYEGETFNGSPHGKGRMSQPSKGTSATPLSGAIYEGEFRQGVRHGQGSLVLPTGDKIEGVFSEGALIGPGTFRACVGSTSVTDFAHWSEVGPSGLGAVRTVSGSLFVGDFVCGEFSGRGRFEHPPDGAAPSITYEGYLADGRAHGLGVLCVGSSTASSTDSTKGRDITSVAGIASGCRFTSDWREGLPDGVGRLEEPHGRRGDLRTVANLGYAGGQRQQVSAVGSVSSLASPERGPAATFAMSSGAGRLDGEEMVTSRGQAS